MSIQIADLVQEQELNFGEQSSVYGGITLKDIEVFAGNVVKVAQGYAALSQILGF